jgi:hypothetical protein
MAFQENKITHRPGYGGVFVFFAPQCNHLIRLISDPAAE